MVLTKWSGIFCATRKISPTSSERAHARAVLSNLRRSQGSLAKPCCSQTEYCCLILYLIVWRNAYAANTALVRQDSALRYYCAEFRGLGPRPRHELIIADTERFALGLFAAGHSQ